MIRYAIATLALVGGIGYAVGADCRSEGTGDTIGVVLTADEMAFTVGQSCTTTGVVVANPKPCFKAASIPNQCQQNFTNDDPPQMNCCVTGGGTKGCTAEGSYNSAAGSGYVLSPVNCANEQTFTCTCNPITKSCLSTAGNAGPCGSKNAALPGC